MRNYYRQNEALVILCIGGMLLMIGIGFIGPIMPLYVQSLGVEAGEIGAKVGLLITVFGAARAAMDIPAGQFTQRFGRRPLLIIGSLATSLSALACGLATNYWQLVFFRLLQGFGSALFNVAALIVIGEISMPTNRGQNLSLYWGSFLVGSSLGPTLGGFIGEYLGDRAAFFCFSGLAFLTTLWFYLRIPETKKEAITNPSSRVLFAGLKPLLGNLNFVLILTVALAILFTLAGSQLTIVPLLGYERFSLTRGQVGLALTLVAIMQLLLVFLAGKLSDRFGRKKLIVPGNLIAILGLVMFALSPSYSFYLMSAVILGIGRGFGGPVPTAYAADIAPPGGYENTMAIYRLASDIGFLLGPVILGSLKDVFGLNFSLFFSALLLFVPVALFAALAKETIHR